MLTKTNQSASPAALAGTLKPAAAGAASGAAAAGAAGEGDRGPDSRASRGYINKLIGQEALRY